MTFPLRGEIQVHLCGHTQVLRLGIGELETIEDRFGLSLVEIVRLFAQGRYRLRHLREILTVALEAAGWQGQDDDVRAMIRDMGPGTCQILCLRLLNVALGNCEVPNDDGLIDVRS